LASGDTLAGTFEFALMADGVAPDALYPLDFDRAFASLDRIRDAIDTWWTTGTQAPQLLTDQQVDLTSAYNGRITDIADQGEPVAIMWEQGMLYAPPYVVPVGAPHRDNAMQLLAFMLDAERQARFSELIAYGPVNRQAYEFLPEERAASLNTTPERLELQTPIDDRWYSSQADDGRPMWEVASELWLNWVAG
jgi:putative spermidine/putrescine transport system substrate-binding protein